MESATRDDRRFGRYCKAGLAVTATVLSMGCGGGGGGESTPPPTPAIASVSVSCSPSSILITQSSTCTPTVTGTGNYSSSVTWSVSPSNVGTVSSAGVFTPAAAGTATITATSTQDTTKSGNGSITATNTTALAISIIDLPTGTAGSVIVTDPNGKQISVMSSQIIAAISGSYTIAAASVVSGPATYYAKLQTQTVEVVSGSLSAATVDYYDVMPQTTKILDSAGIQSLQISSDGTTLTISAGSAVAQSLQAGNVLIVPPTASGGAAPTGFLCKVTAVSEGSSTITVTAQPATLADAFERLAFQLNTQASPSSTQSVHTAAGVVFYPRATMKPRPMIGSGHGSATVQDPCGDATLGVFDIPEPINFDPVDGVTVSGQVELCAGINVSVDLVGKGFFSVPQLNAFTATATVGEYSDLTVQGEFLNGSFDPNPVVLATLPGEPIPVPGLPMVWVTPEISVFVGASGDIATGFSTEAAEAGSITGGVTYSSGQWMSVQPTPSLQFSYTPPVIDASVEAKAYAGVEMDLDVWNLLGPSFKPDGYLDFNADIAANPWWTLTGGVEGPMSLDVSFLGEDVASYDLGDMFNYSKIIKSASGPFSPSSSNPAIQSLSPTRATAGGPGFTLNVIGSNFVPGAAVNFGNTALTTMWVNSANLTAAVPAAAIFQAGAIPVTVTNPGAGAGTSTASSFTITQPAITLAITPTTAQIPVKALQQFTATVTNTSNTAVDWSVNGVAGGSATVGTISTSGLYVAPATVPNPATINITATSQADTSVSASAAVTIGPYSTKTLYSFTSLSDGAAPSAPLIQGKDGNFYGTTQMGGTYGDGTVFKVDMAGNVTTLHEFSGSDGSNSIAPLVQANDGNFYGETPSGGAYSDGTVFKIDSSGNFALLYSFTGGSDGGDVVGGLIQAKDNYLYGTAFLGGAHNSGAVFRMDLTGNITTLYSFTGGADGYGPIGLIQGTDGLFYGGTQNGGDTSCTSGPGTGCGTIFKIDSSGNLQTLHTFAGGEDGAEIDEPLFQSPSDGYFYGTAVFGGDPSCSASTYTGCGTIFKIDSAGDFTPLHSFTGAADGGVPFSSLIQAGDGDFYGTATAGGDPSCSVTASGENFPTYIGCGTVFKMDTSGNVSALYSFQGSPNDGSNPFAALAEGTDGYFYGTTRWGGTEVSCPYTSNGGCGTFFRVAGPGGPVLPSSALRPGMGVSSSQEGAPTVPARTVSTTQGKAGSGIVQKGSVPLMGLKKPE